MRRIRNIKANLFNNTPGGTKSQLLNGGNNLQVGVARSFAVYPGDKVKIVAHSKYEAGGSASSFGFASALLQAFSLSAPAVGEIGTPSAALDAWGALVDGGLQDEGPAPQAFVNIVVFDEDYNLLDAAWDQVSENAEQVGLSPDVAHDEMIKTYTITEPGFVFLYVSNNSPVNMYFDDVEITHTPTNVIQYNARPTKLQRRREYYPFGLQTSTSWTRTNSNNNFLYNAANELNATSGWYEMFHRNYDPALGRMMQVDPFATSYSSHSTYNYAMNNPAFFNDPNGGQAAAPPPGVSASAWNRIERLKNRNDPNYFENWSEDFGGGSRSSDAAAVRNGEMTLYAYASKYGTSVSPVNYDKYLYPDAQLLSLVISQNGFNFGYNVILNALGNISYVSRVAVEAEGDGWYEAGAYSLLYDDHNFEAATGSLSDFPGFDGNAGDDFEGFYFAAAGAALTGAEKMMFNKETWFSLKQMKGYSHQFNGNGYTGGKLKHGKRLSTTFKVGGWLLGAYTARELYGKYERDEINGRQLAIEQTSNGISTFGGLYGVAWGLGWSLSVPFGPSKWYGSDDSKWFK